jgi:septum formation protein
MKLVRELVLASESPRRKQLLQEAGFAITVYPVKVSESLEKNLNVEAQIQAISRRKWEAARDHWNRDEGREVLLLTADTMVVLGGQALGKPSDSQDAVKTLESLSGKVHQVMTAITLGLTSSSSPIEAIEVTDVWFRPISRQQIEEYVKTGEPLDKAGSYAIQGRAWDFVEKFVGSFDNVVGLPMELLRDLLQKNGWVE